MDTDDIHTHLDEMAFIHKCLSRMGVALHDHDYASIVLMSLPKSYTTHLKTLDNAASSSRNPLTAHNLITKAIDSTKTIRCMLDATPSHQAKTHFRCLTQSTKGKRAARS